VVKRHAAELQENAASALQALAGGEPDARGLIGRALHALTAVAGKSARLDAALGHLRDAEASAAEAAQAVERFLDALDLDPGGLDELEERKALYVELRRKYRREVPDLVAYLDLLRKRIARQEASVDDLADLAARRDEAGRALSAAAAALRERRVGGAGGVSRLAEELIRPLALPDLELQFTVAPRRAADSGLEVDGEVCDVRADGGDEVDLLARPNPGERAGQVAAIASGGERSRIHLGLTALRRRHAEPPLQLFDEIDAGLGMDRARPVARLLRRLAGGNQVICITHLATVAVYGDHHWRARKAVVDGRTLLDVDRLAGETRDDEVARLLGGDGTTEADVDAAGRAYARDLLREAREEFAPAALRDDLGKGG
jgi:DNA repair protein RecN (Recombination protein N)